MSSVNDWAVKAAEQIGATLTCEYCHGEGHQAGRCVECDTCAQRKLLPSDDEIASIITARYADDLKGSAGIGWISKAANRIITDHWNGIPLSHKTISSHIATLAELLVALLQETRREHGYLCIKCKMTLAHWGMPVSKEKIEDGVCTCGADAWNKRIDEVLNGA